MMKYTKILLLFLAVLFSASAMGKQEFDSSEICSAAKSINAAEARTTHWARNIARLGHLDKDSSICWVFNVNASDSLYIASVYDCIRMFVNKHHKECRLDRAATSPVRIVIKTVFPKILYSDGNMSFAGSVDAHGEMVVDVHPTNLVITMKVQRYVNTAPYGRHLRPSYGTVWLPVRDVSPLKDNGNTRTWSKAFINSNAECLNLAGSLVSILNDYYTIPEK